MANESMQPSHIVTVDYERDHTYTPYASADFERIQVDTAAAGRLLSQFAGDTGQRPSETLIVISATTPVADTYVETPGGLERADKLVFSETWPGSRVVHLNMGNVAKIARRIAADLADEYWDPWRERRIEQRTRLLDASAHLVDGLSRRADALTMGVDGLRQERVQAETSIRRRTRIAHALGGAAVTVGASLLTYANHKLGFLPSGTAGVVAGAGTVVSNALLWLNTRQATLKKIVRNEIYGKWPIDLRASARVDAYRRARAANEIGELVTYRFRGSNEGTNQA